MKKQSCVHAIHSNVIGGVCSEQGGCLYEKPCRGPECCAPKDVYPGYQMNLDILTFGAPLIRQL